MSEEVWRERDTSPSKVEAALRTLLTERYHDEVEHARRDERVLVAVALGQQLAQRRLDPARRRVALAPDLLGHGALTARARSAA